MSKSIKPEELQKSIFANVLNYYIFRISREDAVILEGNIQMEMAVHNSFHYRREMLTKLANRECIVRVCSEGRVLSAMKAKTLDFIPIPRKKINQILNTEAIIPYEKEAKRKEEKPSILSIGKAVSLKDIMASQSSGREQVI